jgi:hypothetical protein
VQQTQLEYVDLMDKLAHLKILNERAQRMLLEVDRNDMEPLLIEMFDRR